VSSLGLLVNDRVVGPMAMFSQQPHDFQTPEPSFRTTRCPDPIAIETSMRSGKVEVHHSLAEI
jgi:hypothetical protein